MEAKKFIVPAAVVIFGVIIYNKMTTDYRLKLQNLPEFDKDYHLILLKNATPKQKRKYTQKVLNAYKINEAPLVAGFAQDKTEAFIARTAVPSSIFLLLSSLFTSKKYNSGFYTIRYFYKFIKNKFQLSIILNRFAKKNIDLKKEIIDNYTNSACRQLYNYIIKLPIIN